MGHLLQVQEAPITCHTKEICYSPGGMLESTSLSFSLSDQYMICMKCLPKIRHLNCGNTNSKTHFLSEADYCFDPPFGL